ncbi:MAG: hypothetical protein RIT43_887 [Bacteroidota bacterium]|jgi:hypothetical protein
MRYSFLCILLCCFGFGYAQNSEGKVWTETGVSLNLGKSCDATLDQTMRFGNTGLETFFPQFSFRYGMRSWFKPSIDYRVIFDKDRFGNFSVSNRLNVNTDIKGTYKRVSFGTRLRYQYSFQGVSVKKYDAEFDQALRVKLYLKYTIKKSPFIPLISAEWFYNPSYGPSGYRFTKERFFAGTQINLDGPHDLAVGYIYDRELNTADPDIRHIANLSYTYSIKGKKKDNEDKKSSGGDLFNE